MSSTSWASRYVGLPFKNFGRDRYGVDCWGLVVLVMRDECGIELPHYGEISAYDMINVTNAIRKDSNAEPWHPVDKPQEFDVLLMRGRPMHVGIMRDEKQVLHIEEKISAVMLPIRHPAISFRMMGFRRHRNFLA